jgi:hypothetical protein
MRDRKVCSSPVECGKSAASSSRGPSCATASPRASRSGIRHRRYRRSETPVSFYLLYDKMYRADVLAWAYERCRENRGASGIDDQTTFTPTFQMSAVIRSRTAASLAGNLYSASGTN